VRRPGACAVVLIALAAAAGCGGASSNDSPKAHTSAPQKKPATPRLSVVALGDSSTTGSGDPSGMGWVGRYAELLRKRLKLRVDVNNLAREGKTSSQLLLEMRTDLPTRNAVKAADVVLFGLGGADLNAGDDNFAAGKCRGEPCYAPVLKSFGRNFDAIVAAVRKLRTSQKTVLRSITYANALTGAENVIPRFLKPVATRIGVYQAKTGNQAICRTMRKYDGQCIDLLRAFNGPDGTENGYEKGLLNLEDCCYPSGKGQQVIAEMLFKTSLAPVR